MGFTLNQLEQERQIRKLQKKEDKDTSNYEQLSNLPKINNVELKGNKTTGDLGINATNVMLPDGVTSVEEAVDELKSGLTNLIGHSTITKTTNEHGSLVLNTNIKVIGIFIDNMPSGGSYTYRLGQAGNTVYLHLMDEEGNDAANVTITVTYYSIVN